MEPSMGTATRYEDVETGQHISAKKDWPRGSRQKNQARLSLTGREVVGLLVWSGCRCLGRRKYRLALTPAGLSLDGKLANISPLQLSYRLC